MTGEPPFLPYGRQSIDDDDIAAVSAVLRSDFLTTGPEVAAFEAAAAEHTNARHAIACNSGTAALHLAVLGLGLGPGDAAIVPGVTFVATANVVVHTGAKVIFADVDPNTGLMTPDNLSEALTRVGDHKARAAMPVHLAGRVCDMPGLSELAHKHDLEIIEDACHALGGRHPGAATDERHVGDCAFSAASTFSLHPVKIAAMGEGGFVTTNSDALAETARRMRDHGIVRNAEGFTQEELARTNGETNPWYYEMPSPGFNYRVPDLACALGRTQLAKLDQFVAQRHDLMQHYAQRLASLAPVIGFPAANATPATAWHLCPVLIDFDQIGKSRGSVMGALRALGIGTQVHYIPVHRQPYYRALSPDLDLPGAEAYYARALSLPLFFEMNTNDVDRVVEALAKTCGLA
jgi:UDP-4-amino-4,6-dideoxy-N-acetyl-beta-L-altrosamine transaminase